MALPLTTPALAPSDIPLTLRAIWVMDQRLTAASKSGGLLHGLNYSHEAKKAAQGAKDLPYAALHTVEDEEGVGLGAGNNIGLVRSVFMQVAGRRDYGLFRRDMSAPVMDPGKQGRGVLEWIEYIKDAIERHANGTVDWALEGSLVKPLIFRARQQETDDEQSVSYLLEISYEFPALCRGNRTAAI